MLSASESKRRWICCLELIVYVEAVRFPTSGTGRVGVGPWPRRAAKYIHRVSKRHNSIFGKKGITAKLAF